MFFFLKSNIEFYLFIAPNYGQLSADIKILKKIRLKLVLLPPVGLRSGLTKTGINIMIFTLILVENCL